MMDSLEAWAEEEFGHAQLGDTRRVDRLKTMAVRVARSPSGTVADVFSDPAELHGAYDWLESSAIKPHGVASAMALATARRAVGQSYVLAATDGSSYTLSDQTKTFETGPIGRRSKGGRGDKIHTVLVMTPTGVPLGIVDQHNWIRSNTRSKKPHAARKTHEKETQIWLDVRDHTRTTLAAHAPGVSVWFQHDREADSWPVVADMVQAREGEFTTVRASWDRRLWDQAPDTDDARTVREALERSAVQGTYELKVPATPRRRARTATMQVRFAKVTLRLRDQGTHKTTPATVTIVQTREVGPVPKGEKRLEWLLLTTWPVTDLASAREVVTAYAFRWRIEEFHKALKSACCEINEVHLHQHERRVKWALILSAVAVRLLRLTYRAREEPTRPAQEDFSAAEIEAVQDLAPTRVPTDPSTLTVSDLVFYLAQLGGYGGSRKQTATRPPGVLILARGFQRVWVHLAGLRGRTIRLQREKSARSVAAAAGEK